MMRQIERRLMNRRVATARRWPGEVEVRVPPRTCRPEDSRCNPGGYDALIDRVTTVETDPRGRIIRLQFHYPAGEPRRKQP